MIHGQTALPSFFSCSRSYSLFGPQPRIGDCRTLSFWICRGLRIGNSTLKWYYTWRLRIEYQYDFRPWRTWLRVASSPRHLISTTDVATITVIFRILRGLCGNNNNLGVKDQARSQPNLIFGCVLKPQTAASIDLTSAHTRPTLEQTTTICRAHQILASGPQSY